MAEKEKTEGLGVSGFTLNVLGIIFSGWVGLILSIVGLIFCLIQQNRYKTRLGKIGVILGIIGIVLSALVIVLYSKFIEPMLNSVSS